MTDILGLIITFIINVLGGFGYYLWFRDTDVRKWIRAMCFIFMTICWSYALATLFGLIEVLTNF